MPVLVSEQWRFSLQLADASLKPATLAHALRWSQEEEFGTISAQGDQGDSADLEFNATYAAVWYMGSDKAIRRAYFPYRPTPDQDISAFYCNCCGVQLCSFADGEYLSRFMSRGEGFRLWGLLLRGGQLPVMVPEEFPNHPLLPGMDKYVGELSRYRVVEWRVHKIGPSLTKVTGAV